MILVENYNCWHRVCRAIVSFIIDFILSGKIKGILINRGFLFDFSLITIIIYSAGKVPVRKGVCI